MTVQQIGRYQIVGELGRGAMGVVYRALDPAIGRNIAIKAIRLSDLTDLSERKRLRERLFREAQSAGILSHPNIVTIYDVAEENGLAYIFMEFVNGPALEHILTSSQPPDREMVLSVFRQTAGALDYAHRKGIVHRDIKPANIMIHDDGSAKITDFGVAKIISQQMTLGSMMGTPNYMSPEQIRGGAVHGQADQFSLAVIAYEILTGEKPFSSEYLPTLLYRIVREEPVAPQRLNPTLGLEVDRVLNRALAKDPNIRFETCSEFVDALTAACTANKDWMALPRGASQTFPTLSGSAPVAASPPKSLLIPSLRVELPVAVTKSPVRIEMPSGILFTEQQPRALGTPENTHLLRNLLFVILGIGAIAFIIFGAQKWFAREEPAAVAEKLPPAVGEVAPEPEPSSSRVPARLSAKAIQDARSTIPDARTIADAARRPPVPVGDGTVRLVSSPPGVTAVVDNNPSLTCTTPCFLSLPPGRHTLLAQSEGHGPTHKIFETPKDSEVFLSMFKVVGTLSVSTDPPGATILIDGKKQILTTPAMMSLPAGRHRLELLKDSLKHTEEIEIKDGAITQTSFTWK